MPTPAAPCADFGTAGVVDIDQWNHENAKWPLSILQPPTVSGDFLFVGWAGKDWADAEAPPGTVFALDARTGALRWTFDTLDAPVAAVSGTGNVWASMSVDEDLGLLYLPVSSPSPNFFGGARTAPIEYATSVTALAIETGEVVWSRQLVHHDIWDYDTNAAPTLVDITRDGVTVPALVQTSKQGFLYVLNRETGEPVYPIEERPVPASTVARRDRRADPALRGAARAGGPGRMARHLPARRYRELRLLHPHAGEPEVRRALHAGEPAGLADLSRHHRRAWNGAAARSIPPARPSW